MLLLLSVTVRFFLIEKKKLWHLTGIKKIKVDLVGFSTHNAARSIQRGLRGLSDKYFKISDHGLIKMKLGSSFFSFTLPYLLKIVWYRRKQFSTVMKCDITSSARRTKHT